MTRARSRIRTGLAVWLPGLGACALLSGCLVERTVTDGSGHVIYQEPEVHTPFESDEKRKEEVTEKERELGWY